MEAVETPERLLTIAEVSRRMSVTSRHVYHLIEIGELPTVNIGARNIRIAESDITDFIRRNRRSHTQP